MAASTWTAPLDARAEVQRLWDRGTILAAEPLGAPIFPLRLRLRRPESRAMLEQFDDVRRWVRSLEADARSATGTGYEIEWAEVEHRQLGRNRIPASLVVPTRLDALRWIGKVRQAERFDVLAAATIEQFPMLRGWVTKKPFTLLEHADSWDRIMAVLGWFRDHPRPGIYLRQIDVPGVDTKFIEARLALFFELLDRVLPPEAVDLSRGRQFESRYGLKAKPSLVRFRILDPRYQLSGLSDITTPISQMACLNLPIGRVFVTENELNGIVFPEVRASVVISGMGYGVELLRQIPWIADRKIHYWGDIDTHGFDMLDRLRAFLPNAHSLLMDRATLDEHRRQWVEETASCLGHLTRLTAAEAALYDDLAANRLGDRVRLEQERVGFGWLQQALGMIDGD